MAGSAYCHPVPCLHPACSLPPHPKQNCHPTNRICSPSSSSLPRTASALARSSARAAAATPRVTLLALAVLLTDGVGGRDLLPLAGVALPVRPLLGTAGLAVLLLLLPRPAGPSATGGAAPPRMAGLRATGGAAPPRIAGLSATGEPALPRMAGLSTPAGLAGVARLAAVS